MSKLLKTILSCALPALLILQFLNNSYGQNVTATVTVPGVTPSRVNVTCEYESPTRNLWFLKDFGKFDALGDRISDVSGSDGDRSVMISRLIPGEYAAASDVRKWSYKIDLSPFKDPSAAAHISWMGAEGGVLMLDDVLPQGRAGSLTNVEFVLPAGWTIHTTEPARGTNRFDVRDREKAVFAIGKDFRISKLTKGDLVTRGQWLFSDEEAVSIANEIFAAYEKSFGGDPAGSFQLNVIKFPGGAIPGEWEADTRGNTVTILSSDMPFRTQALQRLHEQLRHEIFHLWIPNGVRLTGSYDWFYEGFALYLSLKNGVLLNRIRFEDFLDTLSRAYMIDSSQNPRLSLIDASRARWTGGNATVYARGMLAAFLCDIALLKNSKGRSDASGLVKEVFEKYRSTATAIDGNDAVTSAMVAHKELVPIVENYVRGNAVINWSADLAAAGIMNEEQNSVIVLKTVERPNSRQKEMLDKLGYNSWRKLTKISK